MCHDCLPLRMAWWVMTTQVLRNSWSIFRWLQLWQLLWVEVNPSLYGLCLPGCGAETGGWPLLPQPQHGFSHPPQVLKPAPSWLTSPCVCPEWVEFRTQRIPGKKEMVNSTRVMMAEKKYETFLEQLLLGGEKWENQISVLCLFQLSSHFQDRVKTHWRKKFWLSLLSQTINITDSAPARNKSLVGLPLDGEAKEVEDGE